MGRLPSEELWRKHTVERFIAFKQSGELRRLHKKGLSIYGRKKRFTGKEWFDSFHKRYSSPAYLEWYNECEAVGHKFGLASWTVVCACLVSGYDPGKEPFPVEVQWPQIRVVTESTDAQFLARLAYEAQCRGLYVVARQGSVETTQLFMNPVPIMNLEPPAMPPSMPPLDSAFHMRVETPIGYPPQAGRQLHKAASRIERELLTALGYSIPQRLRTSRLVSKADDLRIAENRLPRRGLYEIVADTFDEGSVSEDERRRRTVKTQRHRLRKRLIEPYESKD